MSNQNTTISINAVDNTAATFSKLEQNAGKVYQNILQQANKNAKLGQDTLKQIEKEIEAYKRKQQIELEGRKELLRQDLKQTYSKESISERRISLQNQEKEDLANASGVVGRANVKRDYQKKYSSFDEDVSKEKAGAEKYLENSFKEFEKEQKSTNVLLKDLVSSLKDDIFSKIENQTKSQINQDAKEALNPNISLTEDEKSARLGANKVVGKESSNLKEDSTFDKIAKLAIVAYAGHKVGQLASSVAGTQDPEHWLANAMGGIPVLGPAIQTAMTRHIDEKLQQDKAKNLLKGTIGKSTHLSGLSGSLGMDISEVTPIANTIALSQHSRNNLNNQTKGFIASQKAFNLNEGVLSESVSHGSWNVDPTTIAKTVGMVASILGTKADLKSGAADTTRLELLMKANNDLAQDQLTVLEATDQKGTVGVLKAFTSLGGRYTDPNVAKERILKINSALQEPKDDYQQARNFAVLSNLNPNASYLELKEQQEKGIYAKGYLSKVLEMNEQQNGSGDLGILALKNQFGFSHTQSRAFMEGYKKDRTMFDNMDEEGIKDYLSQNDIMSRGAKNVTDMERNQAEISDAFGAGVLKGVTVALAKDMKIAEEAFSSAGKEITKFATNIGNLIVGKKTKTPNETEDSLEPKE